MMIQILEYAKELLRQTASPTGTGVDLTMGNGHDTLFLSRLYSQGQVYAFDIQQQAVENTRALLEEAGQCQNTKLILDSHSNLDQYVPGPIDGALCNLGYLPGGDKSVTTRRETTRLAIEKTLQRLKPGGILAVAIYPGHEEGALEGEMLQELGRSLCQKEYDVLLHRLINVPHSPYLICFQRRKQKHGGASATTA